MRTRTYASLLVLTGSAAGFAQITDTPPGALQNNTARGPVTNVEDGMRMPDMPMGNRADAPLGNETIGNNPTAL